MDGDANVRSVWLCSRNDAIGNVVVMMAAAGVWGTGTAGPCASRPDGPWARPRSFLTAFSPKKRPFHSRTNSAPDLSPTPSRVVGPQAAKGRANSKDASLCSRRRRKFAVSRSPNTVAGIR